MSIEVIYQQDHFIIRHQQPILTFSQMELGFSELSENYLHSHYGYVICDFSSIERIVVSEAEMDMIAAALIRIFAQRPEFQMIDLIPGSTINQQMKVCHNDLRGYGIGNIHIARSMQDVPEIYNRAISSA